jgi:hypothetical protein
MPDIEPNRLLRQEQHPQANEHDPANGGCLVARG